MRSLFCVMQNYELLIERIAKSSGLKVDEVEVKVEAKKAKLSGLISREGAAQIVAAELGISLEDEDLKINEISPGMRRVNFVGKVMALFPVREFEREGRAGKVANLIVADETGSIRVVLWDANHISLIENEDVVKGDVIEVKNASARDGGEVHLSGFSELKKSSMVIGDVKSERIAEEVNLGDVRQGQNVKCRGSVVQIFQPRFYSVCPECNKKVIREGEGYSCAEHGKVSPKERAILNFILDDGIETMRVVMFSDQINLLIKEADLSDESKAAAFRDDFLGTEIYLSGVVKRNQLFNNLEIVASGVEKADADKLIEELETKA